MKHSIFIFLTFLFLTTACDNDTSTPDTTDSTDTTTTNTVVDTPITEPIGEENTSPFTQLSSSTYALDIAEDRANQFVAQVTPKQNDLAEGNRSDTLYSVDFIPYKDQEVYVYQSVVTTDDKTSNKWCLLIRKNGTTLVDEHVVAEGIYQSLVLNEMKVGDKEMVFTATKTDGSTESIALPYDGKTF